MTIYKPTWSGELNERRHTLLVHAALARLKPHERELVRAAARELSERVRGMGDDSALEVIYALGEFLNTRLPARECGGCGKVFPPRHERDMVCQSCQATTTPPEMPETRRPAGRPDPRWKLRKAGIEDW